MVCVHDTIFEYFRALFHCVCVFFSLCFLAETWKQHRRILNPTFSLKVLTSYVSVFNEKAKIMCDNMALELGQGIDMYRFMFLCTMDITVSEYFLYLIELNCVFMYYPVCGVFQVNTV